MDIWKQLVLDPNWQALRLCKLRKHWSTFNGVARNIQLCDEFIGAEPPINNVWCVLNCVNGVVRGFGAPEAHNLATWELLTQYKTDLSNQFTTLDAMGKLPERLTDEVFVARWQELHFNTRLMICDDFVLRFVKPGSHAEVRWALDLIFTNDLEQGAAYRRLTNFGKDPI